jgi:hypothetical protein
MQGSNAGVMLLPQSFRIKDQKRFFKKFQAIIFGSVPQDSTGLAQFILLKSFCPARNQSYTILYETMFFNRVYFSGW